MLSHIDKPLHNLAVQIEVHTTLSQHVSLRRFILRLQFCIFRQILVIILLLGECVARGTRVAYALPGAHE